MHPVDHHPDLTENRLQTIAHDILEQVNLTYDTNSGRFDSAYTRGCVIFGRVKDMLMFNAQYVYPFSKIVKQGMDLVATIGEVPFRFAADLPDDPQKKHILFLNEQERGQYELAFTGIGEGNRDSQIYKWRWYIQKIFDEDEAPSVYFVGLDEFDEVVVKWEYEDSIKVISAVDGQTPLPKGSTEPSVTIPEPQIGVKKK